MTRRQTILVAGATGSIGGAAALALAKRGARVVLLGRRAERLHSKADSIRDALTGAGVEHQVADVATLVVDFSDMDSVRAAAEEALTAPQVPHQQQCHAETPHMPTNCGTPDKPGATTDTPQVTTGSDCLPSWAAIPAARGPAAGSRCRVVRPRRRSDGTTVRPSPSARPTDTLGLHGPSRV